MSETLEQRAREWMQQTGEYSTELCAEVGMNTYNSILETMGQFARAELCKAAETAENALTKRDYTQSPPAVLAFDIANEIREQAQ